MPIFDTLAKFIFARFSDAADLRGRAESDMAAGSVNQMPLGTNQYRPFKNLAARGAGSRRMFQIKDTWGGLDDVAGQAASGSLFSFIADSLLYAGFGQVSVGGANIAGAIASSQLRALLKWNNSYTDPNSGPFIIGLPEPDAPEVGVLPNPPGGTPTITGNVHFKYARLRETLGGKSRASGTSAILSLNGEGAYLVVPLPANGQTHHIIFVSTRGLGGAGLSYRMSKANPFTGKEYLERDVQRRIQTLTVADNSKIVASSVAEFSQADVGKRFAPASTGISVPANTIVASVESATQLILSGNVSVTGGASNPVAADLISFVAGIDRAVALNWQESDLAAEAAEISWIYDFPPPACSHAFALGNRLAVATFADSAASASATRAGTALVFSLANQFESFDLRFPLYLPEALVDTISRGIDAYSFVATKRGIYAVQFLNSDTIPATVSVLLSGGGIDNPNNWAISNRGLYVCTGDHGNFVRVGEAGATDALFYEPVARSVRHWTQAKTVIVADPKNNGIIFAHESEAFYFDEQTETCSTLLLLGQSARVIAGVAAETEVLLALENQAATARNAFAFDCGTGDFVASVGAYARGAANNSLLVQQIAAEWVCDKPGQTAWLGVHGNNLKTFSTRATIAANANLLHVADARFTAEYRGCFVLVKGAGTAGAWLLARIGAVVSPTAVSLVAANAEFAVAAAQNAGAGVAGAYVLIARQIFPLGAARAGSVQVLSPEIFLTDFEAVAASLVLETTGIDALPLAIELMGSQLSETRRTSGATWGG